MDAIQQLERQIYALYARFNKLNKDSKGYYQLRNVIIEKERKFKELKEKKRISDWLAQ